MLITLLVQIRQATEARRRLAETRDDIKRRPPRDVTVDRTASPRPRSKEPGRGD